MTDKPENNETAGKPAEEKKERQTDTVKEQTPQEKKAENNKAESPVPDVKGSPAGKPAAEAPAVPTRKSRREQREENRRIARERRMKRRHRRNARLARFRWFKYAIFWVLGVLFMPIVIVVTSVFIPVGLFTGNNEEVVSGDLNKKSLFEVARTVATDYGAFGFSDFPIILNSLDQLIEQTGLDQYVAINTDALRTLSFSDNIPEALKENVEVIATIDSLGLTDMMGDIARLSVINEFTPAGTLDSVAEHTASGYVLAEGENPKQYYYESSAEVYERAFKNDGTPVPALADGNGETQLFYPALKHVRLLDLVDILDESFGRVKVLSVLDVFGVENATIEEVIGADTTVSDLKDFDVNKIRLAAIIPVSDAEQIYDILCGAVTVEEGEERPTPEQITVGHLTSIDINNIPLSAIIDEEENAELFGILESAAGVEEGEELTIGTLLGMDIRNVPLSAVIDTEANAQLFDILCNAIIVEEGEDRPTREELTIGDISRGIDVESIPLSAILDEEENADLFNILENAVGLEEGEELTIGNLYDVDINRIPLNAVLGETGNDELFDILCSAVIVEEGADRPTREELTIGDVANGIDIGNIPLNTVLDEEENADLYSILNEIITPSGTNGEILVKDLSEGFDIDKIPLETVIARKEEGEEGFEANDKLWTVLEQAVTHEGDKITVGDLANGFDIDNVNLNVVVAEDPDDSGNVKFWSILRQATGTADGDPVLIGALSHGFNVNDVELKSVINYDPDVDSNKKLWDILEQAVTHQGEGTEITLDDLNYRFDINKVALSSVIPETEDTETLWDILEQAVTHQGEEITLGDLSAGFDIGSVELETVLPRTQSTATLWDILDQAVTPAGESITVDDLTNGFDIDSVKLNTVIAEDPTDSGNVKFWSILRQATGTAAGDDVLIGALSQGFNVEDVELKSVINYDPSNAANQKLWAILEQAVTHQGEGTEITLDDLNYRFDINNVALESVLPRTTSSQTLWNIIDQAVTPSDQTVGVTISDLSAGFDINEVKLSAVVDSSAVAGNKVLSALIAKDVKLGDIGSEINDLSVTELFDDTECFTTVAAEACETDVTAGIRYSKDASGNYTLSNTGTYYVSRNAKIWLFILYQEGGIDPTTGVATTYTALDCTFSQMGTVFGGVSDKIINATIRQLVESGILTESSAGAYQNIYGRTVKGVFDAAALLP